MRVFVWRAEKIKRKCYLAFLCMVAAGCVFHTYQREKSSIMAMQPMEKKVVVLDAGHGGWDPGRVGIGGADEKIINLKIVEKLQKYLEQSGAIVLLTRDTDVALSNDKREDMRQRKEIVNESEADILVSIHQNYYPKANVRGGQVFYLKSSEESKRLAETLQARLVQVLDPANHRVAKDNGAYYILKQTKLPGAIVECGFLSNPEEERLLNTEEYQEKVAWAVYLGIMDYFTSKEENKTMDTGA